jgi:TolA-binding protein
MKPALAAAGIALVLALFASVSLVRETRRRVELERRVLSLEEILALREERDRLEANSRPSRPKMLSSPDSPSVPEAATSYDAQLQVLEARIDRLDARLGQAPPPENELAVEDVSGLTADQLWQKAQMATKDRFWDRSVVLLREFLKSYPGDPRVQKALRWIADKERYDGNTLKAAEYYGRILKEFPESKEIPYVEYHLGTLLIGTDLEAGREHFERSVTLFTSNAAMRADALVRLGDAYSISGKTEIAREYLRRVAVECAGDKDAAEHVKAAEARLKALEGK